MIWIVDNEGRIVGVADKEWGFVEQQLGPRDREKWADHGRTVQIDVDLATGPISYDPKATPTMVQLRIPFRVVRVAFRDPSGYDRFPAYFLQVYPDNDMTFLKRSPFIDLRHSWGDGGGWPQPVRNAVKVTVRATYDSEIAGKLTRASASRDWRLPPETARDLGLNTTVAWAVEACELSPGVQMSIDVVAVPGVPHG